MSVLVYTENWEGKFKKLTWELVSYASSLAESAGTGVTALTIGNVPDDELAKLGNFGAGRIINIVSDTLSSLDNQAYAKIIADTVLDEGSDIVILSNNNSGRAIAPRLSVRLKAGIASGVSRLPLSLDPFTVYKRTYSGSAFGHLVINSQRKVLTLAQNSYRLIEKPTGAIPEKITPDIEDSLVKTRVRDVQKQEGKVLLTDAEIVVSGGRGMKSPDNWGPLTELASLLGGATACSRPVSDEGWRPHEEHTGQTGKIISPNLYLAVGIRSNTAPCRR